MESQPPSNGHTVKLFAVILSVVMGANLALSGWTGSVVAELMARVAAIEGNRFTSQDALRYTEQLANLRETVAGMPKEIPPSWFRDEVRTLQLKHDALTDAFVKHLMEEVREPQ